MLYEPVVDRTVLGPAGPETWELASLSCTSGMVPSSGAKRTEMQARIAVKHRTQPARPAFLPNMDGITALQVRTKSAEEFTLLVAANPAAGMLMLKGSNV